MNKTRILLIALVFNFILMSCQDPVPPEQNAVKMTKAELKTTIGYEWFNAYWNLYNPNSNTIEEIALAFDPSIHKFVLFIEPACTCKELVREPADMVKVLDMANIDEDYYEMYSMGSIHSKHPFEDKVAIKSLPQIYLVKSGDFVYSILDTFNYYIIRDNSTRIEKIVLNALNSN